MSQHQGRQYFFFNFYIHRNTLWQTKNIYNGINGSCLRSPRCEIFLLHWCLLFSLFWGPIQYNFVSILCYICSHLSWVTAHLIISFLLSSMRINADIASFFHLTIFKYLIIYVSYECDGLKNISVFLCILLKIYLCQMHSRSQWIE